MLSVRSCVTVITSLTGEEDTVKMMMIVSPGRLCSMLVNVITTPTPASVTTKTSSPDPSWWMFLRDTVTPRIMNYAIFKIHNT